MHHGCSQTVGGWARDVRVVRMNPFACTVCTYSKVESTKPRCICLHRCMNASHDSYILPRFIGALCFYQEINITTIYIKQRIDVGESQKISIAYLTFRFRTGIAVNFSAYGTC